MIYKKTGEKFIYEGVTYRIGAEIVGTEKSEYAGLNGYILEIRTDDDKDTENETPDIYCCFEPPCLPRDIEELEKRFSELYDEEKHIDDIILDLVIMAPDMVLVPSNTRRSIEIYVLEEDWAINDDCGHSTEVFSNYYEAKAKLNALLDEEMKTGCLLDWKDDEEYQFDADENSFEGWLDGWYSSNHYSIDINKRSLNLTNQVFGNLGRDFIDECRIEDFIGQIEDWEEVSELSEEQYRELIADKTIPERIHSKLSKNDSYFESYWESVSEVGFDMIHKYIAKNVHSDGNATADDAEGGV